MPSFKQDIPKLIGLIRSKVGGAREGEVYDCIMDAYVQWHQDYENFQPSRPWIYTVAIRILINRLNRRNSYQSDRSLRDIHNEYSAILPDYQHDIKSVKNLIRRLKREDRMLIYYHYIEGWQLKHVANFLDCSIDAVHKRHQRILKKCRKHFNE